MLWHNWSSKDNLKELIFSSTMWVPRFELRSSGSDSPYPLSHLTSYPDELLTYLFPKITLNLLRTPEICLFMSGTHFSAFYILFYCLKNIVIGKTDK